MKTKKEEKGPVLIQSVLQSSYTFRPDIRFIKERIEELIKQNYIIRRTDIEADGATSFTFVYNPE